MAQLTGCPEKGDSLIAQMEIRKKAALERIPLNREKPTVYYVVGYGKNGEFTGGGDTFIHHLITLAGGKNIAADIKGWNYNLEDLMTQNPDIILICQGWKEAFCSQAPYNKLKAVQNNHVYEVNKYMIEVNGPRIIDGLESLIDIFWNSYTPVAEK